MRVCKQPVLTPVALLLPHFLTSSLLLAPLLSPLLSSTPLSLAPT